MTIDTTEAVRLAAEALLASNGRARCESHREPCADCGRCLSDAEDARYDALIAVTDALPALAEQFAQAVEARRFDVASRWHEPGLMPGQRGIRLAALEEAARLIREVATDGK